MSESRTSSNGLGAWSKVAYSIAGLSTVVWLAILSVATWLFHQHLSVGAWANGLLLPTIVTAAIMFIYIALRDLSKTDQVAPNGRGGGRAPGMQVPFWIITLVSLMIVAMVHDQHVQDAHWENKVVGVEVGLVFAFNLVNILVAYVAGFSEKHRIYVGWLLLAGITTQLAANLLVFGSSFMGTLWPFAWAVLFGSLPYLAVKWFTRLSASSTPTTPPAAPPA